MAANDGEEATVSLVDVLEEDEELENEASAVLAGSDSEKCSYPEVMHAPFVCETEDCGTITIQVTIPHSRQSFLVRVSEHICYVYYKTFIGVY